MTNAVYLVKFVNLLPSLHLFRDTSFDLTYSLGFNILVYMHIAAICVLPEGKGRALSGRCSPFVGDVYYVQRFNHFFFHCICFYIPFGYFAIPVDLYLNNIPGYAGGDFLSFAGWPKTLYTSQ